MKELIMKELKMKELKMKELKIRCHPNNLMVTELGRSIPLLFWLYTLLNQSTISNFQSANFQIFQSPVFKIANILLCQVKTLQQIDRQTFKNSKICWIEQ
jgi:hypothetical protein